MLEKNATTDLTLRVDRGSSMVVAKRGEYVCNVCQMQFNLEPGTDAYDPKRGLGIKRKMHQPHNDNTRDTIYESEIVEQFTKYTDLVPINVFAMFMNKSYYVRMDVKFQGDIYSVQLNYENGTLNAMLIPNQ